MESMALFGEADSVTQPNSGQNISAQHATTASLHYPGLRQPVRRSRRKLARSSLKMKRVDPARARVSASHGVLMSPASRAEAASAARSSLLPSKDQFFSFRSAIHLHGSTPHRKSGVVSGHRAERRAAEPIKGKHDRAPCHSLWNGKCSKEWRGQVHRHRVPARHQLWLRRASGAPGEHRRQVADIGSTNDFHKIVTSGVTVDPIRGSELQGQVTTATPFAPQGAGHQEGQRESTVDIGPGPASRGFAVKRSESRGL